MVGDGGWEKAEAASACEQAERQKIADFEEGVFAVDSITDLIMSKDKIVYSVVWVRYPVDEATWEPDDLP